MLRLLLYRVYVNGEQKWLLFARYVLKKIYIQRFYSNWLLLAEFVCWQYTELRMNDEFSVTVRVF